ncbi:MAG: translation elongation factor 4 [Candidatus Eisenbacteria sp.]|nr:translation elongation factor 4 [Candidatus Eisenbacteria bacterium]
MAGRRDHVRNFCIVAHIDHGKSTLADRILERTGAIPAGKMRAQVLDDMDLERERGITIKAHAIKLEYTSRDGDTYELNLIDTPGHVDFSYEVSRSLAACEGAILLIDATQGIEAQTVSNLYMAIDNDLDILPVLNKIDMDAARPDDVRQQVADLLGSPPDEVLAVSAKTGEGVDELLEKIIRVFPPPPEREEGPMRALIFDSQFDSYRGVIVHVRVMDGALRAGQRICFLATKKEHEVQEVGTFRLGLQQCDSLRAGDVGYVIAGVKDVADAGVGDTLAGFPADGVTPLPGYAPMKPMVFSGLFPVSTEDYGDLKDALAKFRLNDAALSYEPETSLALGFGFRCGFLGPLHLEVVQERIQREYGLSIIATTPNVSYRVHPKGGGPPEIIDNPSRMPDMGTEERIEEPFIILHLVVPPESIGMVMKLLQERRGIQRNMEHLDARRMRLEYLAPLGEILYGFFDRLKTVTRGYGTMDYEFYGYRASDMVRLDVMLNGEKVDALSLIVHEEKAYEWGRRLVDRLKDLIPRQLFKIAIQAATGRRVIARSTVNALRKDVTAKCYGGDVTRKRKLLEKQKEGKKRMKQIGTVHVPQEAFLALLRATDEQQGRRK